MTYNPAVMTRPRILVAALAALLVPALAASQALPNLMLVRVTYNTRKATAKPQGELKAQIDALDQEIAKATRAGRTGEMRRLFAKGMALLNGQPWTEAAEFAASLTLRTDHVVVDSSKPYAVRLEQIFAPSIELPRPLTAVARIRPRQAPAGAGAPAAATAVKDLGTFDGVGRDLRESPFLMALDLAGVGLADGPYALVVEVLDQTTPLGTATLNVTLHKGLDAALQRLEAAASAAPPALRDDILFPVDRIRTVDRGRVALGAFNVPVEIAAAEAVAAAAKNHTDPYAAKRGDFKRHYLLDGAGEIMPYRLYVPTTYTPAKPSALVIALHGLGQTEDSFFDGYAKGAPQLAESRGYILVAPFGYRVDGFYGCGVGDGATTDPAVRRTQELSERDVMEVIAHVRQQYTVDANRIYLMGHSMGGIGTWCLAAKYPDVWAAIGPMSGFGTPSAIEKFAKIPEIVVHGDNDATVAVSGSRSMVAKMKELGVEVAYIEIPGGDHIGVVSPNLPAVFDFFDAHRKAAPGSR